MMNCKDTAKQYASVGDVLLRGFPMLVALVIIVGAAFKSDRR
ncbi:MAG: hypothetical protein ACR2P1_15585 [Pseudomonadales bacterium]